MKQLILKTVAIAIIFLIAKNQLIAQAEFSYAPGGSDPCIPGATPWVVGGNNIGATSNCHGCPITSDAGTCNNAPFVLKANNFQSVFIQPSGKIGINNPNPVAALDVLNPTGGNQSSLRIFGDNWGTVQTLGHMNLVYGSTPGADFIISEGTAFNSPVDHFTIHQGRVGIDESMPSEKFHVNGNARIIGTLGVGGPAAEKFHVSGGNMRVDGHAGIGCPSSSENLKVQDPSNAILKVTNSSPNNAAVIVENTGSSFAFYTDVYNVGHLKGGIDLINFKAGGSPQHPQVWIGKKPTTNHTDFQLAVDGKLVARSIYVTLNCYWADYVFETNYQLPKLEDVETFYKANKHLPEIPTSKEVEDRGIDVAEMNALLLKKVEELTLYVVEQQKEINKLKEYHQK